MVHNLFLNAIFMEFHQKTGYLTNMEMFRVWGRAVLKCSVCEGEPCWNVPCGCIAGAVCEVFVEQLPTLPGGAVCLHGPQQPPDRGRRQGRAPSTSTGTTFYLTFPFYLPRLDTKQAHTLTGSVWHKQLVMGSLVILQNQKNMRCFVLVDTVTCPTNICVTSGF